VSGQRLKCQTSPIELKELRNDDLPRAVAVRGEGKHVLRNFRNFLAQTICRTQHVECDGTEYEIGCFIGFLEGRTAAFRASSGHTVEYALTS